MTFTKTQWEKLLKLRELLSNTLPPGSSDWDQVLECAADKLIKLKDKSHGKQASAGSPPAKARQSTKYVSKPPSLQNASEETLENQILNPHPTAEPSTLQHVQPIELPLQHASILQQPASPASQTRQHIPISIQRQVFKRDQCCQYLNKHTGKKCESKWHLHIDHVQPLWANGSNELGNLRLLCAGHNQEIYRWQANITRHH